LSWVKSLGIKHSRIEEYRSSFGLSIKNGDEIYKGYDPIMGTLVRYEMGKEHIEYTYKLLKQGFPK